MVYYDNRPSITHRVRKAILVLAILAAYAFGVFAIYALEFDLRPTWPYLKVARTIGSKR